MIVGAGPVARSLARAAQPRPVTLIDTNPDLRETASEEGLDVVYGSALDDDVLEHARTAEAGCVIAMTPNSRVNVLAGQMASHNYAVPCVLVALGEHEADGLTDLMRNADAAKMFDRPVDLAGWDYALANGSAREVIIEVEDPPFADTLDRHLGNGADAGARDSSALPLLVLRGEQRIPFPMVGELERGDRVFTLTRRDRPVRPSITPDELTAG